jgi:hypothetical protein
MKNIKNASSVKTVAAAKLSNLEISLIKRSLLKSRDLEVVLYHVNNFYTRILGDKDFKWYIEDAVESLLTDYRIEVSIKDNFGRERDSTINIISGVPEELPYYEWISGGTPETSRFNMFVGGDNKPHLVLYKGNVHLANVYGHSTYPISDFREILKSGNF